MKRAKKRSKKSHSIWQSISLDQLRLFPFWMFAALTILVAYRAPYGRRTPEFNFDMSWDAIWFALHKPLHIAACALLMVLGVMAYKWQRWWLAALLTMVIGLGWEIAQTTVIGHNPRLADLAPDLLGVMLGWLIVESLRYALAPDRHIFG